MLKPRLSRQCRDAAHKRGVTEIIARPQTGVASLSAQRRAEREGRLPPLNVAVLNSVDPNWREHGFVRRWRTNLKALDQFIEREGHARVPHTHMEGQVALGKFVAAKRVRFNRGDLEPERAAELSSRLGWVWNARDARVDNALAALDAFIAREGHADVPTVHVEGDMNLGSWVMTQRNAYRAGKLADQRIAVLEQRPEWVWNSHDAAFSRALGLLDQFIAREGHARASQTHVEDGHRLGRWVNAQRNPYAQGKLSQRRIDALESRPQWMWTVTR